MKRFVWQGGHADGCSGFSGDDLQSPGLDVEALIELKKAGRSVAESPMRVG